MLIERIWERSFEVLNLGQVVERYDFEVADTGASRRFMSEDMDLVILESAGGVEREVRRFGLGQWDVVRPVLLGT